MYYCIQVSPNEETRVIDWIRKQAETSLYNDCFYLTRVVRRKVRGNWTDYVQKLLPGYVFLETSHIDEMCALLRRIPLMTRPLGRGDEACSPLTPGEEAWLLQLKGANGEASLSFVRVMDGGEVKILSGPLTGLSGHIKKIHLHKRIAEVEISLMGVTSIVHLGIEIVKPVEAS